MNRLLATGRGGHLRALSAAAPRRSRPETPDRVPAPGLAPRALEAAPSLPVAASAPQRVWALRQDFTPPVLLAIAAVAINLLVSGNLLMSVGIPYATDGGNFLVKLHPGTYLAALALAAACWRSPVRSMSRLALEAKVPALFLTAMVACFLFAAAMTGKARLVVFVENFMPPAILAMVLRGASRRALRCLGYVVLGLLALNVLLSLPEAVLHRHIVPVLLSPGEDAHEEDFRPTALFDHPLTAAMMAMIGLFLSASPRLRLRTRLVLLPLMALGLLSFGGRTALVLSVVLFGGWQGVALVRRARAMRLTTLDVLLVPALGLLLPVLAMVVLTQTSLGERIATHFYWDESAQVRSVQWNVLGMMEPREALFGMTLDAQERATHQLGLAWRIQVIENFWLLLYLYLGAVGFVLFASSFVLMLGWTFRQGSVPGRLMLVGVVLAASTSNSLGRKANILTVLVPAVMASAALAEPKERRLRAARPLPGLRQP